MRLSSILVLSVAVFATASLADWGDDDSTEDSLRLRRRDLTSVSSANLQSRDVADGGDDDDSGDETGSDEEDYRSGVFEQLSDKLVEIQPSVDEIKTLSNNANDDNADETASSINAHLDKIYYAGNSIVDNLSSSESSEIQKREVAPRCLECLKKKLHHHKKHKHCHKCEKRSKGECGKKLWEWLKACKDALEALKSCKSEKVKDKCKDHVPKFKKGCDDVVSTCGQYGVSDDFHLVAQVDLDAFAGLDY